jgi:hypothetical protein
VGIPGLFSVRRYEGAALVDGGLTQVDESLLFSEGSAQTLTIRIMRDRVTRPMQVGQLGWKAYIQRVASLLLDAGDEPRYFPGPATRSLMIRAGSHSAVDFELSRHEKLELFRLGYDQCDELLAEMRQPEDQKLEALLEAVDDELALRNSLAHARIAPA